MSFSAFCIIFMFGALLLNGAVADTLREKISRLEPLTLHYGVNSIKINARDVLLVKGAFVSETAWGGDGYSVLVDEGRIWQFARTDDGLENEVIIWSVPHTEEDSVTSISFLVPRGGNAIKSGENLYLLRTHRNYDVTPYEIVPAEFSLYILQRREDFGIYIFQKLESLVSSGKYCNAEQAAFHELGIPLPDAAEKSVCAGH
ncbi:MAG: hypothetical protein ABL951_07405 [Alphaproteobacteria bacterium]